MAECYGIINCLVYISKNVALSLGLRKIAIIILRFIKVTIYFCLYF